MAGLENRVRALDLKITAAIATLDARVATLDARVATLVVSVHNTYIIPMLVQDYYLNIYLIIQV